MGGIFQMPQGLQSLTMAPAVRLTLNGIAGAKVNSVAALDPQLMTASSSPSMIRVEDGANGLRIGQCNPEGGGLEGLLREIARRAPPERCALARYLAVVLPRDSTTAVVDAAVEGAQLCAGLGFDAVRFYFADEEGNRGSFLRSVPVPLRQPILVSAGLVSHGDLGVLIDHLATHMKATSAAYETPVEYALVIDDDGAHDLAARSAFLKQLREAPAFGVYDAGWLGLVGGVGLMGGALLGFLGIGAESAGLAMGGAITMGVGIFCLVGSDVDTGAIPKSLTLDVWDEGARLARMERSRVSYLRGMRSTWS